jgi:RHS repeat-associated protein
VRAVTKVVNGQVQVVSRHDFKPFGEEVAPQTPPVDKRLFTGKERDAETGWDYFEARYYPADLGRFTTVDPGNASAMVDDPQSWNSYAYGRNNALRFIDPDGRRWFANNGYAVWVEPNKDGTYTSPGDGWVELDPKNYNYGMNLAFVNGTLSRIGEDSAGHKMLSVWTPPEEGLQDTTLSLAASLWLAGSAVRAAAGAIMGARAATEVAFDITAKGARYANLATKLTAREFQANLISSGFRVIRQTIGPNGPVTILSDGQKIYTIYTATSTGTARVQVANAAGQILSKIRLAGY